MALNIHLTKQQIEDEFKKQIPMANGWYVGEVLSCTSEQSKDRQSINYVTVFGFDRPDGSRKEIKFYFNSKPFGQTIIVKFFAAVNKMALNEFMEKMGSDFDLNFDNTIGKKVNCKVIQNIQASGAIFNNIDDFASPDAVPF